jgi:hypothetical protein
MSIFGTIMTKIFGSEAPAGSAAAAPTSTSAAAAPAAGDVPAAPEATAAPSTAPASVDVEAILDGMDDHGQDLDWRKSIVDLLKLLGLDSSLGARKTLAHELHYDGDTEDSAAMNIWLHKQVMAKLAENGGKVPAGL